MDMTICGEDDKMLIKEKGGRLIITNDVTDDEIEDLEIYLTSVIKKLYSRRSKK